MAQLGEALERAKGYYREFVEALRDYEEGAERIYAVERLAQLIAQALLDFAAMLASRERGVKPETYRALAKWLAQRAGLGKELAEFLEGLAGFRNILVHMYAEIDTELEHEAFHEIKEKTPRLIQALEQLAREDPCLEDILPKIRRLAKQLGLRYVLVYGSLARHGCGHDVDLAVKLGRRPKSMLEVGRLQLLFEDELGAPVDLVVLDIEPPPLLAKTIVDEAIHVYGDEKEATKDLLKLYKLYLDHAEEKKHAKKPTTHRSTHKATARAP